MAACGAMQVLLGAVKVRKGDETPEAQIAVFLITILVCHPIKRTVLGGTLTLWI